MCWRRWLCWCFSLENIYITFHVSGLGGVEIILTPEDTIYGKFHLTAYSLVGLWLPLLLKWANGPWRDLSQWEIPCLPAASPSLQDAGDFLDEQLNESTISWHKSIWVRLLEERSSKSLKSDSVMWQWRLNGRVSTKKRVWGLPWWSSG